MSTDSASETSDMTDPSRFFCFRFSRFLCAADLGPGLPLI